MLSYTRSPPSASLLTTQRSSPWVVMILSGSGASLVGMRLLSDVNFLWLRHRHRVFRCVRCDFLRLGIVRRLEHRLADRVEVSVALPDDVVAGLGAEWSLHGVDDQRGCELHALVRFHDAPGGGEFSG